MNRLGLENSLGTETSSFSGLFYWLGVADKLARRQVERHDIHFNQLAEDYPELKLMRDYYLSRHIDNVTARADALALSLGLPFYMRLLVHFTARFHDWGKVVFTDYREDRKFGPHEHWLKDGHAPESARRVVVAMLPLLWLKFVRDLVSAVKHHHHPHRAASKDARIAAFVVFCADILEGCMEDRGSRKGKSYEVSLKILEDKLVLTAEHPYLVCWSNPKQIITAMAEMKREAQDEPLLAAAVS